jgi:uncharacterized membrane protein
MTSILIIMNNYFHDVATAVLLGSAVVLWVLGRNAENGGPAEKAALARAYSTLTRFAWGAIAWIVVGGIPRTIFFTRYEWDPAVVKGIVPALALKHILMFTAVVVGAFMWRRVARLAHEWSDTGVSSADEAA